MIAGMNKATVLRLTLTGGLGVTACSQVPDKPELKGHMTANSAAAVHARTNRLAREKSPYLLQHQYNPVDWYAWGDEAFGKARQENKPLFLSIGYSTCHWCHVMERESFESEEVAKFLNEHFVSIKVDREERPDVDKIYMNFVQATTGSGGWPLNVFITPDLKPIFGGTYWPGPRSTTVMGDHIGFVGILEKISDVWKNQRQRCLDSSKDITAQLQEFAQEGNVSRVGGA